MRISKRLKTVASLVDKDAILLDVGCDHAMLDIYLALNNPNMKIYASDVNKKPLSMAKANLAKYNLTSRINLYLADGLLGIDSSVNTVVISGMGTKTIIEILSKAKSLGNLGNVLEIIIASNLDYDFLRKFMSSIDYCIDKELVINEKDKFYVVIKFIKGKLKYNYLDYKYGPILRKNVIGVTRDYFLYSLSKKEDILNNLSYKNIFVYLKIKKEIRELKKLI